LADYALQFSDQVRINPTTIDCENMHNPALFGRKKKSGNVVIGWTGSHSTLKYLRLLEPVLQRLENQFDQVSFLVIADQPPQLRLSRLDFIKWNSDTEIEDLLKMDIGIMPLPDDEWSKGKCGFKALQYMALEIPSVISPVGVNTEIISEGVEGFLCSTDDEWLLALNKLIQEPTLRETMGKRGRKKIIDSYSVSSNMSNFLSLFE
jgi:glycosyltransferase involved in cell wall biosynthesis